MTRTVQLVSLVALAACVLTVSVASAVVPGATSTEKAVRNGGTFRVSVWRLLVPHVDPAFLAENGSERLLDATCARLMRYPDRSNPERLRLIPEVALRAPEVSRNFRRFVFTLRRGFQFSDGAPVRANAFARAINRVLAPAAGLSDGQVTPGATYMRVIEGADAVLAGRRRNASGVRARGLRLEIRLTRPTPDFVERLTMTHFCAVPPALPVSREGVGAFHSAGPYYIAEYVPRERVVLRRNRYYGGTRPRHVDVIRFELRGSRTDGLNDVEAGRADWTLALPPREMLERGYVARFGVNRDRFFVAPGASLRQFVLNTSRGIFRNNPRLRQAANLAIDRAAQIDYLGGSDATHASDQYLPQRMRGFRDARIYPLGRPSRRDLARANRLASGNRRGGKAVLYTRDNADARALSQLLQRDLARIGIDVEIRAVDPNALGRLLARPGEPWDIGFHFFPPPFYDPAAVLNAQFQGRFIGAELNISRFDSRRFNRRLERASRLRGAARYREYGKLDVDLARSAAPTIAVGYQTVMTLVSSNVDPRCLVHRPELILSAVCLKRPGA